jgi:hypothetical protein
VKGERRKSLFTCAPLKKKRLAKIRANQEILAKLKNNGQKHELLILPKIKKNKNQELKKLCQHK